MSVAQPFRSGSLAGNVYLWSETLKIDNALNFTGSLSLDVGPVLDPASSSIVNGLGSMQINHQPVQEARPQDAVGIKVTSRVRRGDYVFLIRG